MAFTKSNLDGLVMTQPASIPNDIPNLVAWIAPPVVGDMADAPQAYIWSGKLSEKRETMAGGRTLAIGTTAAFRVITHEVTIFIKYAMSNEDTLADNVFPIIVDNVMEQLRGVVCPVSITDPNTGWPSNITHFGEEFEVWYGNIHEAEDQRMWVYEAEIRMPVRESVQQ